MIIRFVLGTLLAGVLLLLTGWSAAALWIDGPVNRLLAGVLASLPILAASAAAVFVRGWQRKALAASLPFALVLAWWLTLAPSNDRDWIPSVARQPYATLEGSRLTVHNVRNFRYDADGVATQRWETRSYDLDGIVGGDLFMSFWGPTLYAHTVASWEFADGQHLAISVETRKEVGEEYSAVLGFFRQYELHYVVSAERDVIGVRTNHRGERVELYRTTGRPGKDRALLLDYVHSFNALVREPEWYNALTQNCTTTIWRHAKAIDANHPFDWRLIANGYLPELMYARGSVDTTLPLDEFRRRSDITARAQAAGDSGKFSHAIRQGLPPRKVRGAGQATPPTDTR